MVPHMRHFQRYAFHIVMTVLVLIMIFLLSLYQGFVNTKYERISLLEWSKPSFWQSILQQHKKRQPKFNDCTTGVSEKLAAIIADPNSEKNIIFNDAAKIKLDCSDGCSFKLTGPGATQSATKTAIKLTTESPSLSGTNTTNLKIHWADLKKGYIIYELVDIQTAYIISFNPIIFAGQQTDSDTAIVEPFLQHDISLNPGVNQSIQLMAVKQAVTGDDFLVAQNINRQELYLYGIQRKWLNKWKLPENTVLSSTQVNDASGCIHTETATGWLDLNKMIEQ